MTEEIKGIVVSSKSKDVYLVKILKEGNCSSCALSKFCSLGTKKDVEELIEIHSKNLNIGDIVIIEEKTAGIVIASFLIFIAPIVFFIAGYYVGEFINLSEIFKAVSGFLLVAIYFGLIHIFDNKLRDVLFKFRVKRVL
ncbi:MAG: SoxR reducing system RseC family protein [candidate division WOR-3 bacterium]